jgi:hypothetical protein
MEWASRDDAHVKDIAHMNDRGIPDGISCGRNNSSL